MNETPTDLQLAERLATFRRDSLPSTIDIAGVSCHYRSWGHGPRGLLLLPGAVGGGEMYFSLAPLLAASHRLIAITYPPVGSLEPLLHGFARILDREGLTQTDVLGGSFGGLVAQAFLRAHPDRTGRVVLSATGPANPARARSNARAARVVGSLPIALTRTLLRGIVHVTLKSVGPGRAFWTREYRTAIAATSAADVRSRYALSAQLDALGPPDSAALRAWRGRLILLEGSKDAVARDKVRAALKQVFPEARVHTFEGGGHAISAERTDEWAAVVAGFLLEPRDPPGML